MEVCAEKFRRIIRDADVLVCRLTIEFELEIGSPFTAVQSVRGLSWLRPGGRFASAVRLIVMLTQGGALGASTLGAYFHFPL